ncbi:hypothetical protein PVAP13_7NG020451 [Panicum virgatum]|uniref:Uncharacterized protein n=1 Tax=Panicum virgatum TaxID=38727 RepID=A0A8T0PWU3_PANVG|nr:hypothetical protein PVAP13_7NG020451 [Panicum virgatum]
MIEEEGPYEAAGPGLVARDAAASSDLTIAQPRRSPTLSCHSSDRAPLSAKLRIEEFPKMPPPSPPGALAAGEPSPPLPLDRPPPLPLPCHTRKPSQAEPHRICSATADPSRSPTTGPHLLVIAEAAALWARVVSQSEERWAGKKRSPACEPISAQDLEPAREPQP